jgi:hypothetical protein
VNVVDQHLENQRLHDIEPLEALIAEFKSATAIGLELHPSYTPGLRRADSLYVDYKLHERSAAVDRILNLLIYETEYTKDSSGRWIFHPGAAEQIRFEILNFWNGEITDRVRTKYIPAQ